MPSSDHLADRQSFRPLRAFWSFGGFWPTVRIIILEVLVLLALAGAIVFYLNWSSEVAFAEFLAAGRTQPAPGPTLHTIKANMPCGRDT
jgi:hypothetical protein